MGPLSACSWLSTAPESKKEPPRVAKGKEAPALAERVKQGKLPALEKRLPARPMVLEPVDRVGIYGGTWDTTILGPSDTAWLDRTVAVVKNTLRNVPESMPSSCIFSTPVSVNPQQWYFSK